MRFSQRSDDQRASGTRNMLRLARQDVHNCPVRPSRAWKVIVALCAVVLASIGAVPVIAQGTLVPDQQIRDEAICAIPLDEMNETVRAKLAHVVSNPTLFRRLPVQAIECDPDMYVFLVRYPEVVVNIWQLMGITKVKVARTGEYTFDAADGAGTISKIELAYGRPDIHVYYGDGAYEGPLLGNRITGRCVTVLHSEYDRQADKVVVSNYMDVFVRLDNVGAEILVKALHPLFGKAADYNFTETSKFLGQVSLASELNGPGMERLAGKLNNCTPSVRQAFIEHTESVYERAVLRQNVRAAPGGISMLPASGLTPAADVPAFRDARVPLSPEAPRELQPIYRR